MTLASIAGGQHMEAIRLSPLEPSEAAVASAEQGDAEPLLKELGSHCSERIALYCRRCMMFYLVSKSLEMDYQEVKKVEPTKLLSLLLSPQPYVANFNLCRNLITGFRPDAEKVADVLANTFVESMLSHGVMPWTDEKLDEFVGLLSPSQELLGNAALLWIRSFTSSSVEWRLGEEKDKEELFPLLDNFGGFFKVFSAQWSLRHG